MSDSPPIATLGPSLFVAGTVALAIGVIGLTVMVAKHSPTRADAPVEERAAPPETAAAPVAAPPLRAPEPEPEPEQLRLTVKRIASLPAQPDPFAPAWFDAPAIDVPLEPQMLASPMLEDSTIDSARVRAITDGKQIAWLISWEEDDPATVSNVGTFPDAVAIQFPLVPFASYMMGAQEMPVHILYWRAQWQEDIDEGFQDMLAMYPNFWSDVYWFAEGEFPYPVSDSFNDPRSHEWFVAKRAGNPMADFNRTRSVDEMIAEGYGSLTHQPHSSGTADGRGVWRDGRWHVVLSRPITDDNLSQLFGAGRASEFGIAIWDGRAGNVGGRKHYSFWVPFEVSQ